MSGGALNTAALAALFVCLAALFAFGANGYVLLWRRRSWGPPAGAPVSRWPAVVVQIPVYNERDVVARAVAAAGAIDYPGPFEVQVVDDSTDDTTERALGAVARLRAAGVHAQVVRREGRGGFKAGALASALAATEAELVLVLDADFVPPPDFLRRAVPLLGDARIGCVQARWGHLNADGSALVGGQALGIDLHFGIEQRARAAAGWPVSFNGSAGLWRREAIESAGGWSADTLTEDLDLSYRAWLRGWRIAYADDLVCPGEVPETLQAFKAQQRRWAHGSTATARKLLGAIWRSRAPLGSKVQATLHLTHYAVNVFMLASALLAPALAGAAAGGGAWWATLAPLALATGGPIAMAAVAATESGRPWRRTLRDLASMSLLGTGLMLSNAIAVLGGLRALDAPFERTPKGGVGSSYAPPADAGALMEIALAVAFVAIAAWLWTRGVASMVPFLALYAAGLGRVGIATLLERHALTPQAVRP